MKRRTQWFGEDWSVFHEERGYNRDRNVPEQIRGKVSIDPSLSQTYKFDPVEVVQTTGDSYFSPPVEVSFNWQLLLILWLIS